MRTLFIPDIHLKPWAFHLAASLMEEQDINLAVCAMDLPDDWGQYANVKLYEETFDAAIRFARHFPNTLWCYGNHELSYMWSKTESGYSSVAERTVRRKMDELRAAMVDYKQLAYVHKIDNVLFMHGGLCEEFVRNHVVALEYRYNDTDSVVEMINALGPRDIWMDISPVWHRPQVSSLKLYRPDKYLQVVGHTPRSRI